MKCLSLSTDFHEDMTANADIQCCNACIIQIFPFNTIAEDGILICELNGIGIDSHVIDLLSSRIFNLFQLNNEESQILKVNHVKGKHTTIANWSWCDFLQKCKFTYRTQLQLLCQKFSKISNE